MLEQSPTGVAEDLDPVWKALANADRRTMLDLLADRPTSTGELAAEFTDLSRFAVMQHLAVLEKAELVIAVKSGRLRINHLNPVPIQQISDRWISRYQRPLTEALIDLKVSLESETSTGIEANPVEANLDETQAGDAA